jgi:NADH dehydrogenase
VLFKAARDAGVERVVHISITNPSIDSPLEYFSGKAKLEQAVKELFPSYAILRPALIFGTEDILINNIAWSLRRFPVFPLFGRGQYRVQPVFVDDLAKIAVSEGQKRANVTINCIGPESPTYREMVEQIASTIGKKRLIIPAPAFAAYLGTKMLGKLAGDIMITWEEVKGLSQGLLCVDSPAAGETKLSDWLLENAASVGRQYRSELSMRKL